MLSDCQSLYSTLLLLTTSASTLPLLYSTLPLLYLYLYSISTLRSTLRSILRSTLRYPTQCLLYSTSISTLQSFTLVSSFLCLYSLPYSNSTNLSSSLRNSAILHSSHSFILPYFYFCLYSTLPLLFATLHSVTLLYKALLYSTPTSASTLHLLDLCAGANWTQWSFSL